jgi:hypothetical protein
MTTTDLRVALAEKLGWLDIATACDDADTDRQSLVGLQNPRSCLHVRIPDLASLVRQAEQGLSEEQLGKYALAVHKEFNGSLFNFLHNPLDRNQLRWFWEEIGALIRTPDDDRARALLEVLP